MRAFPHVFQPIAIGSKQAKNRIEAAPAAPFLAGHDGSLTPEYHAYIRELAASGAGIVTLGVTSVDPGPRIGGRVMTLGSDLFASDFNEIAELIHGYDALACAEVVYSRYMLMPPERVVNETSTEEVEAMIECFVEGVARLARTGFDMALIHGGHGNVPAMFFSRMHNRRSDRFGGSFEGRCRFAAELLEGIRKRCGDTIALEYRISAEEMLPGSTTFEETQAFVQAIAGSIDLLHVSRGLLEVDELLPYINAPLYLPKAMNLPFARKLKESLNIPVTVVGSFDLALAEEAIAAGAVDMVSMIRTIYADTRCVEKARLGRYETVRPCIRCNTCIDRTHTHLFSVRCAVNPLLGRESRFASLPSGDTTRKITIVGGGPAGLEAARTLASKGYRPMLFERESELGGLLRIAGSDALKHELQSYMTWSIESVLNEPAIDLRLGIEATPAVVRAEKPDVILLACGSRPIIPSFENSGSIPVVWIGDIQDAAASSGPAKGLGDRVLIAGAGMTGMELALSLARQGKQIALVDLLPYEKLGAGASTINLQCLKNLLKEAGVVFYCGCSVLGVGESGMVIRDCKGVEATIDCDAIVLSFGFKPDEKLLRGFEEAAPQCYRIGDCNGRAGTIFNATQSAFDRAISL